MVHGDLFVPPRNPRTVYHEANSDPSTPTRRKRLMDVLAFQRKWIDASRQKERSAYVTHFNDLCDLLGVDKPLDADPSGETYGFEKCSKIAGCDDVILSRLLALNEERGGEE